MLQDNPVILDSGKKQEITRVEISPWHLLECRH